MKVLRISLVVVSLSVFALSACPHSEQICDAQQSRTCLCADDSFGLQSCADDGLSWSNCSCDAQPDAGLEADASQHVDAGRNDAHISSDANASDSALSDSFIADSHIDDANSDDAGTTFPHQGFGDITGQCDVLDTELIDANPSIFINHIDFNDDPYDEADKPLLTSGGRQMINAGNANANSLLSEVFAYEVLARCEDAALIGTENSINYDVQGKITDFEVKMDSIKIGVSVVRAVHWPFDQDYTLAEADEHIRNKLLDIQESSANVSAEDAWQKQVLSVIAYNQQSADSVMSAWEAMDTSVKSDTIVFITVSDGDDTFMY